MFVGNWVIMIMGAVGIVLAMALFMVLAGAFMLWKVFRNSEDRYRRSVYTRRVVDWIITLVQKEAHAFYDQRLHART